MKKACPFALLGALAALSLACSRHEEKPPAPQPATPQAANPAAPSPTPGAPAPAAGSAAMQPNFHPKSEDVYKRVMAAQPKAEISQGELPAGFPSDLPLYPDAKPKTSMMVSGEGLVVLATPAPISDVLSHFREQLPAQGWTIDSVKEAAGGGKATMRAHKDMRSATISVNQGPGGAGSEIGIALKGSS